MSVKVRPYNRSKDYDRVSEFLVRTYRPGYQSTNWLQPRWEYMHFHPNLNVVLLDRNGVWDDDTGKIVAVAHYEDNPGQAYFEIDPDHTDLKGEMLAFAEANLCEQREDGQRAITVFIDARDTEFESIAQAGGYQKAKRAWEHMSQYVIPASFPGTSLPEGFSIQSLADENDLSKIDRVLWRGFNHPGPPEDDLEGRRLMQSAPNFRKDLTIVAVAPDGQYASFCGMWYDVVNRIAYVEPVATDPAFRRMGLGRAAVLEGVRRCGELGATCAFVGSGQPFYQSMGFRRLFPVFPWIRML